MKITLNAEYEDARKVARCYENQWVTYNSYGGVLRAIINANCKTESTSFIVASVTGNTYEEHLNYPCSITIDTTQNQPCIYACMKEGLKVEVEWENERLEKMDLSCKFECRFLLEDWCHKEIKSIKILDLEKMQGVEVEE